MDRAGHDIGASLNGHAASQAHSVQAHPQSGFGRHCQRESVFPWFFFSHPSVRVFLSFFHLGVRECVIIVVRGNNRTHGSRRRASRVQRLRWYLYINASQSLYYSTIVTVGLQISCYLGSNTRSIGNYVIAAITAISALLSSERVRERLKTVRAIEKRARTYAPLVRRVSKRRASITAVRNTISLIINNNYRRDRFVRAWFSVFVIISTRAAAVRVFFFPPRSGSSVCGGAARKTNQSPVVTVSRSHRRGPRTADRINNSTRRSTSNSVFTDNDRTQ